MIGVTDQVYIVTYDDDDDYYYEFYYYDYD